jgi:mannose-1-phosphate guanylyltransferase
VKAVILAGGEGTRLRPLTLSLPKPVVPVVDRPFLRHQLDLLATIGVREIVFSVAYRPERIEAVFGNGSAFGVKIHYAVEDPPLGTGGAVRNALSFLDERTVVLNGDVLTDVDLQAVVARHEATRASATLVLAPVPNPSAYGLVETAEDDRVLRFVEKPEPSQITTNNINAGIYILETRVLELIPAGAKHSIERAFYPELLARGDRVTGFVHRGYWIDIGTPEKYLQVHRDILGGEFPVDLGRAGPQGGVVAPSARVSPQARLVPPFYIGPGCVVEAGAEVGPAASLVADVTVAEGARVRDSVVWRGTVVGRNARLEGALVGPGVTIGPQATVKPGAVLGEGSILSEYSRNA